MKILLVDDEPSILEQSKIFLEKEVEDLTVETVISAEKGLELLDENYYEAIVSDYQMPNMDGLEFLENVRKDREDDIPFIVFTGKGREEVAMEALNLGADRYLRKGGDPKSQYGVLAQAIIQEIEHSRIDEKLQEREKILSEVVEGDPIPTFVLDEDHEVMFWNKALEDLSGIDSEKIIGTDKYWQAFYKDQRPLMADLIMEEADEDRIREYYGDKYSQSILEDAYEVVDYFPNLDENGKWLHFTACPIRDDQGKITGAIETLQDITERKKRKKKLQESEERLRKSQRVANVGSWEIDLESGDLDWSDEAYRIFEVPIGKSMDYERFLEFIHPEDREYVDKKWNEAFEVGEYDIEHRIIVDGETKWVREKAEIKFDDADEPLEVFGCLQDITDRKKIEEKYKTFFDQLSDALFLEDTDGKILDVNKASQELLGYSYEELVSMEVSDLVPEEEPAFMPEDIEEATREGKPLETVNKRKDGTLVPIELRGRIIEIEGEEKMLLSIRDITERKKQNKKLRKYRRAIESSINGIAIVDLEERINYVNPAFLEMFRYNEEEVIGKSPHDFVPETMYDKLDNVLRTIREKGGWSGELEVKRKNGEVFPIQLSTSIIEDREDNPAGMIATIIDVTERKMKEKERIEAVREAEREKAKRRKLEEVAELKDEFISMSSHELKTPLTPMKANIQYLKDESIKNLDDEQKELFRDVGQSIKRLESSVNKLLKTTEIEADQLKYNWEEVNPISVLEKTINELKEYAKAKNIDIKREIGDFSEVRVDKNFLSTVMGNLLENAIKFSPTGGEIIVGLNRHDDKLEFWVEDMGEGIPEDDTGKIFDKFYQVDATEEGVGLGLNICKRLIEALEGDICVESEVGEGSKFCFTIPLNHQDSRKEVKKHVS